MKNASRFLPIVIACMLLVSVGLPLPLALANKGEAALKKPVHARQQRGRQLKGEPVKAEARAEINVAKLAREQADKPTDFTPRASAPLNPVFREEDVLPIEEIAPAANEAPRISSPKTSSPSSPDVASPSPATSYIGHSDVPKVGTGSIVIPPDTTGAVGLTKSVTSLNNNFVIHTKSTGAQLSAVSQDTFWTPAAGTVGPFDPRIVYDPYNGRWIVAAVSNAQTATSSILIGISSTSDPSGAFTLFRVDADAGNTLWADFPTLGFNRNWVSVNVNMITIAGGTFSTGKNLVLDYAQLRAGTFAGSLFSGSGFTTSPALTYSTTENNLYAPTHLSSGGGTYRVDIIAGTPPTPTYTIGATLTRTGGGWTQPNIGGSIQIMPQAAPLAGASSCGATPCRFETQDSQIRSNPVFRNGSIYYAQTIGLPAGVMTRTAVQWTRLTASTGAFADGGRIDDPTATQTNGGKWYAYPSIAVNSINDVMLGWSQFASNQFAASGYSYRFHSDAPGTMRDPLIYKAGEDYYSKTFGGGRNRFGDYSVTQVDPSNDLDLWSLQQYSMLRVGTDDGNTGSNSSRWSTWWARVAFDPTAISVTIGGRVQTSDGDGISRAQVTLITPEGATRTVLTNRNGRYEFRDVLVGGPYIIQVNALGFQFNTRELMVFEESAGVDFVAQ
jgi:hypothetical protein